MFSNYIKLAWRNITRHKAFSIINVLGLALGICACIVIFLITNYEFSFDKFHPNKDRIYRIVGDLQRSSGEKEFLNSLFSDMAGMQNSIPGFESTSGVHYYSAEVTIQDGKNSVKKFESRIEGSYQTSTVITWPQYFDIFTYKWLAGSPQVLNQPFKVVLSAKRARTYFGDIPISSMIGKTVTYEDSLQVTVGGIVEDWVGNTDFGYTDFISISTATHSFLRTQIPTEDWSSLSPHRSGAFVKLAKEVTASQINTRIAAFVKDHVQLPNQDSKISMRLQALTDMHFSSELHRGDDGDDFRKAYLPTLYILMGISLFILIIAIVNFINLSTAQSTQRSKEIGMRKVMGGNKSSIRIQFLTETFLLTLFAVVISILLVNPVLGLFKDYIPAGIRFDCLDLSTSLFLLAVTIVTSLLAGFYPSHVLSAYSPLATLKNSWIQKGKQKIGLRKSLIVFQFTISIIFIIVTLVIGKQINFMNRGSKGFNTDAIVTMNNWNDHSGKLGVLAQNIGQLHGVDKVLLQANPPMGFAQSIDYFKYKGKDELNIQASAQIANDDFIPFYHMKLIAGRNMLHGDSLNELVINETMARKLGFTNPQDAVGMQLYKRENQAEKPYPIVGVVADFHISSFRESIRPTVIENVPERKFSVAVKLAGSGETVAESRKVLAQIEQQWKKVFPGDGFNYSFLNDSIAHLYDQERKTVWLINVAMIITIFISCMGLFGLGMFTAQRRTKEIGIRKVLGASIADVAAMLSKDFVLLVLISLCIASPIAYYFMNEWLQDFAYRTNLSWWIFILAGLSAIMIALITISFQAIKAALANPVKSLRTE